MGVTSQTAITVFNGLSRPLSTIGGIIPTELFPRRKEVDAANGVRLDALKTKLYVYKSRDTGKADEERKTMLLKNMVAQSTLEIRVGAQVMLIKNMDEDLVNGSIGKVLGFYTAPEVYGSAGNISPKAGNGFIRDALLKENRVTHEEREVAEREKGNSLPESGERFPLVEFWTPRGKETVLVGRSEFKVEENDGTVAAKRVQVGAMIVDVSRIPNADGVV